MSFRSMLLLQRSAELEEEYGDLTEDHVKDAIVIVERRPQEMSHLATILESLEFQILSVSEQTIAMRLIRERTPRMVLSSHQMPPLRGYRQLGDMPAPAPFVYVPESDLPRDFETQDSLREQEPEISTLEEPQEAVEQQAPVPGLEESLATAEAILKGFRESEPETESPSEEMKESREDSDLEEPAKTELTRVQKYRAEFLARQKTPEAAPEQQSREPDREQRSLRREKPEPSGIGRGPDPESQKISEEPSSAKDLNPAIPEHDYSIIERINAEEIASLSHGDVLSEGMAETSSSPRHGLYQEARTYVLESIRIVDGGQLPDLVKGESISEKLVSSIEADSELLLSATDRTQDFAISSHSVNTSVFAVRIAQTLGLSHSQKQRIALAALLHEIGVVRLPRQLVYKTEKPTLEEIKILRKRPVYAVRCLQGVDSQYDWLGEVVGQVYERENGTGHPLGLTGREICEEAKVIGIADLFDACIHSRPYRDALTGYQALFELTTDQARTFSDRIVKALIKSLSLFPYNEFVVLSSGEIGKVVEINLENLSRPVVEVIYDKEGAPVENMKPIDLAQNPTLYISKALPHKSLPSTAAGSEG